jgi:hypothetical protein
MRSHTLHKEMLISFGHIYSRYRKVFSLAFVIYVFKCQDEYAVEMPFLRGKKYLNSSLRRFKYLIVFYFVPDNPRNAINVTGA